MISFTVLAFELVLWQSSDISVSIVSNADIDGGGDVSISVLNTAGSTLLFYESPEVCGKIEYLGDKGWVEYCNISYTADNEKAISPQYGGLFAELKPGEIWEVSVPEEAIEGMKNGTYRIKMTYITAKNYRRYIDSAFESRNNENSDGTDISIGTFPENDDVSVDSFIHTVKNDAGTDNRASAVPGAEESFFAASVSEVYVKTFNFSGSEDIVSKINIEADDISETKDNPKIRSRSIPDGNSVVLP